MSTDERLQCFTTLFGAYYAEQLVKGSYRDLWAASQDPRHPLMIDLGVADRARLHALLRLCQLYYKEQEWSPLRLTCTADVVRLMGSRNYKHNDRVISLLVLDANSFLQHEVLVQMGGSATAPPQISTLLRHALLKGAERVYLVDCQPVDGIIVAHEQRVWFDSLQSAFTLVGVELLDCIFLTPNVVFPLGQRLLALEDVEEELELRAA